MTNRHRSKKINSKQQQKLTNKHTKWSREVAFEWNEKTKHSNNGYTSVFCGNVQTSNWATLNNSHEIPNKQIESLNHISHQFQVTPKYDTHIE